MEAVEFEFEFAISSFTATTHAQTSLVVCWDIRKLEAVSKVHDWLYRYVKDGQTISVIRMKHYRACILTRSQIEAMEQ